MLWWDAAKIKFQDQLYNYDSERMQEVRIEIEMEGFRIMIQTPPKNNEALKSLVSIFFG